MSTTITIKRQKTHTFSRAQTVEFVSLTDLHEEQRDVVDHSTDPYVVLRRKTQGLAELLGCSEAEAQRMILEKCDA